MKTYLDTSALYAILSVGDEFHERAVAKYQELIDSEDDLWIDSLVFEELVALVWHRAGKTNGIKAARWLLSDINIRWLGEDGLHDVLRLAESSPEQNLSLVDWSLVRAAREEDVWVFTFDENIKATGVRVIP